MFKMGKTRDVHAVMLFSMIARTVGASIPLIFLGKRLWLWSDRPVFNLAGIEAPCSPASGIFL
ncbi:MAG: hypothetical protein CVU64_16930 [Deltaproteobacteria bacterium HGW-Deltaproteobacteria-21]|nr:MAG: hypothetical protein CVU64_16930 [Deltaproteobacteria bacterium HGW-Deltaproteobacteria-21]